MVDDPYNRPIQPIERDEGDTLNTPQIERIRDAYDEHDDQKHSPREIKKRNSFAAIVHFIGNVLGKINVKKNLASPPVAKDDVLIKDLERLKLLFLQLAEKDVSENVHFASTLSDTWSSLTDHSDAIEEGSMVSGIDPQKVRTLSKTIGKFPEGEEHTLGYYLKEHAGKDWLPFPYMELLKKLHRLHAVEPTHSPLQQWIEMLEEILSR